MPRSSPTEAIDRKLSEPVRGACLQLACLDPAVGDRRSGDEGRRPQDVRRRQPAAVVRRPLFIFLKLVTDDGIEGVGEVYGATFAPERGGAHDRGRLRAPRGTATTRSASRRSGATSTGAATRGRPDISLIGVLSGIEMACWDIVGKAVGKPAYELLGGRVHERLRSYTYLYPVDGDRTDVYTDPSWPPSAPPNTCAPASQR